MRVIIQVPSYNEQLYLPATLKALPKELKGVDEVYWLVINDGSTDDTVQAAINAGADFVISHTKNLGLARTFQTGLEACLWLGADIIVNTDADNQYNAEDIQTLVDPIIKNEADYVVGARPISNIEHFSPLKKFLQKLGSKVVNLVGKTQIEDTTSGFRAMNRRTALRLNVFNEYTYTLETLIQSGQLKIATAFVPVRVNAQTRPSRLISSTYNYLKRSSATIFRSLLTYNPLKIFLSSGSIVISIAVVIGVRFLIFYFRGEGSGHIQSLLLTVILFVIGTSAWMLGMLADLISVNRRMIEDVSRRVKRFEAQSIQELSKGFPDLTDARWDFPSKGEIKKKARNEI